MPEHSARSMRYDSRQNKRLNAMSTQRSVTPRSCVVSQCTGRSGVRANVCVQDLSIIQLFVQPWTTESLSQLHASCMMQDVSFRFCNCRFQVILLENLFRELTASPRFALGLHKMPIAACRARSDFVKSSAYSVHSARHFDLEIRCSVITSTEKTSTEKMSTNGKKRPR